VKGTNESVHKMLKDAPVKCSNCKPLLAHVTETQVSICKYFWSSHTPSGAKYN